MNQPLLVVNDFPHVLQPKADGMKTTSLATETRADGKVSVRASSYTAMFCRALRLALFLPHSECGSIRITRHRRISDYARLSAFLLRRERYRNDATDGKAHRLINKQRSPVEQHEHCFK